MSPATAPYAFHLYEILSDEKLSALGRSLVEMVLHKGRKPRISLTRDTEHTLWPLYLVAKQLVQAATYRRIINADCEPP